MRFVAVLGLLALTLTLTTCGKPASKPSGPSGTLSFDDAKKFAAAAGDGPLLNRLVQGTDPTSVRQGFLAWTGNTERCSPAAGGNLTDADADSAPVAGSFSVDCSVDVVLKIGRKGTFQITDTDDGKKLPQAGFLATAEAVATSIALGKSRILDIETSGSLLLADAGNGSYTLSGTFMSPFRALTDSGEIRHYVDATLTPSGTNTGSLSPVKGYYVIESSRTNLTLEMTGTQLTYGPQGITGGTIVFRDGANNRVSFAFSSDGTATKNYNGATLTDP